EEERIRNELGIEPRDVVVFVRTVYINASIFYFFLLVLVLLIASLGFKISEILPIPPYIYLVVAYSLLACIAYIGPRRLPASVGWALVLCIVLLLSLFTIYYTYNFGWIRLIICILFSGAVIHGLVVAGAKCRKSCLPNALVYAVIVFICAMGIIATLVLCLIEFQRSFVVSLFSFLAILAMAATLMQSQFIHCRTHYVPLGLELICALGLFVSKWTMLVCALLFAHTTDMQSL
ncbi:hypothetical protein KR059_010675, partial [Drosophila kikkawai]